MKSGPATKVTALGDDEARLREAIAKGLDQGVAPLPQRRGDRLDVPLEGAGAAEFPDDRLGDHARRDVLLVGEFRQGPDLVRGSDQVADPDPRRDRL